MDSVLILILYILLIVPVPGQLNTYNADHFISALYSTNSTVQDNAVLALIEIGGPAIEPLIQALKDNDSQVRGNSAKTFGKIRDIRAVGPLVRALKDNDNGTRANAVIPLGDIKDGVAAKPLMQALRDNNSQVREYAAKALTEIAES